MMPNNEQKAELIAVAKKMAEDGIKRGELVAIVDGSGELSRWFMVYGVDGPNVIVRCQSRQDYWRALPPEECTRFVHLKGSKDSFALDEVLGWQECPKGETK